jgi:protein required for attachment to host cells
MSTIWIVVADSSRARVFSAEKPDSSLIEVHTLAHPEARMHEGDLVSDKSGRGRSQGPASHDVGHESAARQEKKMHFAARLCETLESARVSGKINRLYVVAEPGFLGLIRKNCSGALHQLVESEIPKNLAAHSLDDIRSHLPARL